jgi:hypothetical protein
MTTKVCSIQTKRLERIKFFLNKYSDLLSSITILISDILFLLGETIKHFPKLIGNTSFVVINIFGLLSLNFHIDLLKKTTGDISFSKTKQNKRIFYISILKTFFLASNILLLNLSFFASLFKFFNNIDTMKSIYQITKPYATFSIMISIILDIFHYHTNKKIITQKLSEKEIIELFDIFKNRNNVEDTKLNLLSAEIRERMDKDTWKSFIINLKKANSLESKKKLFENVILKNIETQTKINCTNLALRSLGYFAMVLCALYPSTFIQASLFTFMSSLYTIQLVYQKHSQHNQQLLASKIW